MVALNPTKLIVLVFACLLMTPLLLHIYLYPPGAVHRTKNTGDEIIDALERHHENTGAYPKRLSELTPKYLKEIKPPVWGMRAWLYERDRVSFKLRVNSTPWSGNGISRYLVNYGTKGKWETAD